MYSVSHHLSMLSLTFHLYTLALFLARSLARSLTHSLTECRCGKGIESPEMAEAWLSNGWYNPSPGQDVWAYGLLLLRIIGGRRPRQHIRAVRKGTTTSYAAGLIHAPDTYMQQVSHTALSSCPVA